MRGKGFTGNVDDLVTYLIVTCNDDTYVAADELVKHRKGLQASIKFILEVRGVSV